MQNRMAYCNGRWMEESTLTISLTDQGFLLGATITERLRTFSQQLFRLEDHLARLRRSLEIISAETWLDFDQLAEVAQQVVDRNSRTMPSGHDQGLCIFVTPGPINTQQPEPTLVIHSYPLPFQQWADLYRQGQSLVIVSQRQVPSNCWPIELKCRSRMHYYLADLEAQRQDPRSRALVLDQQGHVAEASTANILAFFATEGVVSPRGDHILPGVSRQVVKELVESLGMRFIERDIIVDELKEADELILCSTSSCLLPVSKIDGRAVGTQCPGEVFDRLIGKWSELVKVDIMEQARQCAVVM